MSQFAAGIHKKGSCLTAVAAMFITASHRSAFCIIWNQVCVWDSGPSAQTHTCVLQSLCNRAPGLAALCLTIYRLRPPFRPRFCVSFCECLGRLGTVDFGGQVKAVILFLNAICSQAGTEPLRGGVGGGGLWSCSKVRRKTVKVLKARTQSFLKELLCWWLFKNTACVLWSLRQDFFFFL